MGVESVPSDVSQWTVESGLTGLPPSLSPEVCFFVVQEKSIACWGWVSPPRSPLLAFGHGLWPLALVLVTSSS